MQDAHDIKCITVYFTHFLFKEGLSKQPVLKADLGFGGSQWSLPFRSRITFFPSTSHTLDYHIYQTSCCVAFGDAGQLM